MRILRRRCIYYIGVMAVLLVAVSAHADLFEKPGEVASMTTQARQDAAQMISQAYQLSGMKEMTANLTQRYVNEGLSKKLSTWVGDAMAQVVAGHKGPTLSQRVNDPKLKAEMQAQIATRLREEIPKLVKSVVYDKLFQGMLNDADPAAKKVVDHIVEAMVKPLNAQADQWAGALYGKAMEKLNPYIQKNIQVGRANVALNAIDIRGTIDGAMHLQTVTDMISGPLADAMGESAFGEMQQRLTDFLNGNLPPEVARALASGPDKVDALIAQGEGYLPSAQLEAIKAKMLALPIMTIPNEVYGSMLAASAARHFMLAIADFPVVNPYEMQRGTEVTRVMIWQLKNKQGFNMSLGQLLDMSNFALGQVGGIASLGRVGRTIADAQDKLTSIETKEKALEAQVTGPIQNASAELRANVNALKDDLLDFQNYLAAPVNEWRAGVEAGLVQGAEQIKDLLPEKFNGIPSDWAATKKKLGISDKVFGDVGDKSVLDDMGVTAEAKKINAAVSDQLASVLVDAAQALLPAPEIKPEEKVPAQNPDDESDYDPVLLHNGEFTHPVVDVAIPGRGLDFQFKRVYRSRSHFMGRLGWNWTHNFEEALRTWDSPQGLGLTWIDPDGRKFFFKARTDHIGEFDAPAGVFAVLRTLGSGEAKNFELTERGGMVTRFDRYGFLQEKCDHFGNCLKCERDAGGVLTAIVDTVGRRLQFAYDPVGRITQLTDNSGRIWKYVYDVHGDLSQVISPATDLFPQGIATGYAYADHLMTQIRDPRGSIFLKNVYGATGFAHGQIVAQAYGGPQNIVKSRYVMLRPAWLMARWPNVMNIATDRVDLRDRRGVVRRFWHNANGNLLRQEIVDARGKVHLGMSYVYNADGMRVQEIWPSGLKVVNEYLKSDNRMLQGVMVKQVLIPLCHPEAEPKDLNGEILRCAQNDTANSRIAKYSYDPKFGDLLSETSPDGVVREWRYDAQGSPLTLTLSQGEREIVTRFHSNPYGQVVSTEDPRGTVTDYTYNGANLISVVRDAQGKKITTQYAYDAVGNITAITLPNGGVRRLDVDAQNLIRREVTPLGYERRYAYDADGDVTEMHIYGSHCEEPATKQSSEPTGLLHPCGARNDITFHFGYDTLDRLILRQEPIDATHTATTRYTYDVDGRLADVTLPEGNRIRMTYDAWGHLTQMERGAGTHEASFAQYQYDADGQRVAEVDGLGHLTELERDGFGDVRAIIYPNQTRQEIARDTAGRVTDATWKDAAGTILASEKTERDPLGVSERDLQWDSQNNTWRETRRTFDAGGNLVEEVQPTGTVYRWQYDALGNRVRADDPLGLSEEWDYNALGLPTIYKSPSPSGRGRGEGEVHFAYDLQGRLTARKDPNGAITKFAYDERDDLVDETPPDGAPLHYTYDGMGRRTQVAWGNRVTHYDWDDNGRLHALTDPLGSKTRYDYDVVDRLVAEHYPDGGVATTHYDANNQVVKRCMPNGNCVAQGYDALGNVVSRQARDIQESFHYDPLGRMTSAQAGDTASQFVYSSLSEVVASAQGAHPIKSAYDANGQRRQMTFSSGATMQWKRDALDRITQVNGPNGFNATQTWGVHGPEKIAFGNGRSDMMTYDAMGNVMSMVGHCEPEGRGNPKGANGIASTASRNDVHYSYNLLGNLTSQNATSYSYDPWQQLVQAGAKQWRYHLNGEREKSATLQFDKNGNLIAQLPSPSGEGQSEGEVHYRYDALDRLQEVQDASGKTIARYAYDALNRRVAKTVSGHTTTYVYDGWEPVEIYEDGKLSQQFVRGDGLDAPFGMIAENAPLYFHRDRLGSVVAVSDAAGKMVEQNNYDAFGSPSPSPAGEGRGEGEAHSSRQYTAQLFDAETGLYYMRNRYYSPKLGQFLTRDPLGYKNNLYATSSLSQPFNLSFHQNLGAAPRASLTNQVDATLMDSNLYAPHITPQNGRFVETNLHMYVANNPLNAVDPWGLYVLRLNRDRNQMNLYSQAGAYVGAWSVRTVGSFSDPKVRYGATPNGYYQVTAANAGGGFVNTNIANYNSGRSSINPASLGMGEVALRPMQTAPGTQNRSSIAIHGGGLSRKIPKPFADHQGWVNTHGCVRMQNADIVNLVDQIHRLNAAGDTQGTLLVYSGTATAASDPFNESVRTDARYWPPNMAQAVR